MPRFRLVAVGQHAKELAICEGGPDLLLWESKPVLLGRGVREHEGYRCAHAVCCGAM